MLSLLKPAWGNCTGNPDKLRNPFFTLSDVLVEAFVYKKISPLLLATWNSTFHLRIILAKLYAVGRFGSAA